MFPFLIIWGLLLVQQPFCYWTCSLSDQISFFMALNVRTILKPALR